MKGALVLTDPQVAIMAIKKGGGVGRSRTRFEATDDRLNAWSTKVQARAASQIRISLIRHDEVEIVDSGSSKLSVFYMHILTSIGSDKNIS